VPRVSGNTVIRAENQLDRCSRFDRTISCDRHGQTPRIKVKGEGKVNGV